MIILIPIILIGMYLISNIDKKTLSGLLGHHYHEDNEDHNLEENITNEESELDIESESDLSEYNDVFINKKVI